MTRSIQLTSFRKNFLAGLFVLLPIVAIVWLARIIVSWFWRLYLILPIGAKISESDIPVWVQAASFLLVLTIVLFAVAILGYVSKLYFGQKILNFLSTVIQRIPLIGTVYHSLDQLFKTVMSSGGQHFRRVVLVEYPRRDIWAIAFVSGKSQLPGMEEGYINLFVPTVPNPTSGFHLIVEESQVRDTSMSVEQAFRTILSLGIVQNANQSGQAATIQSESAK